MKTKTLLIFVIVILASIYPLQATNSEEIINEVYLLARQDKLLAFSGVRNNWFSKELRTGETVISSAFDGNVAVAQTSERALAFSGITGRWAEERLRIRETVISISAEGNVATVITDIRALGFSAKTGVWVESRFKIGD